MDTETASITKQLWVGLAFAAVISLGLFLLFARPSVAVNNNSEKLVTIHDNYADTPQTIVTRAATVGAALAKAKVPITNHDAVEPAVSTPLNSGSYNVNVYHARPVTIVDGSTTLHVISASQSAAELAQLAGLTIYPEDVLELSQISDFVGDHAMGLKLTIHRATALTLVLYGQPMLTHTMKKTVDEMLASKGVQLGAQDGTSVPLTTPITAGMTVEVWRNGVKTQTVEEPVPFTTKKIQAADQPVGYKLVQTKGVSGKQLVTYQINLQNGKEVGRTKIQAVEIAPMTEQVEVVGTKLTNTFSGSFAEALARLRGCEAGGSYSRNSGNGYYGAYQFSDSTWAGYGGFAHASDAPPSVQDQKAWETYRRRGWQPWPACSRSLGLQDIYR